MTNQESLARIAAALAELSVDGLSVDAAAQLNAIAGQLDAINAKAKASIRARIMQSGAKDIAGVNFRAVIIESVRATIDVKALRAELPEIAARYERAQSVASLTFKASGAI